MSKRTAEPLNAVQRDAILRDRIMAEKLTMYGMNRHMFTQIETDQDDWKPTIKRFPDRDCYEPIKYPRAPKSRAQQSEWDGPK